MSVKIRKPSTPKHKLVYERLRDQIDRGELKVGDKLPSYGEMLRNYGVHTNTSEKVFARLEQEGLIERQNGVGIYVSNRLPRAVKNTTRTIGLSGLGFLVGNSSTYWANLNDGVREVAERAGVRLLFLNEPTPEQLQETDGVIFCDFDKIEAPKYVTSGKPCVSILAACPGIASVVIDDYACGRVQTEHLFSLGHRRVACLHAQWSDITLQRTTGYQDAFKAAGLPRELSWSRKLTGQYDYGTDFVRSGYDSMVLWLEEGWRNLGCTGIVTHNDEAAIGVIKALHEAGLSVPDDVSVVGIDGMNIGSYLTPSLTTIELPMREVGETSLRMLLHQMDTGDTKKDHVVLPVKLRINQSTCQPHNEIPN